MSAAEFWRAVLLALLISAATVVSHEVGRHLLGGPISLRLSLLLAATLYVGALLVANPVRSGRVVAGLAWLILAGVLLAFDPALSLWLFLPTLFIWLLRSLQRYASLMPAAADAALSAVALAASISAAMHSHSLFLALWSYLLIQALHHFLPTRLATAASTANSLSDFDNSLRNAETALRRLSLRA